MRKKVKINLPSKKKEISHHSSQTYLPKSMVEVIQWFTFLNIMEHISDKIETQISLLPL